MLAFQARDEGSIPSTRTINCFGTCPGSGRGIRAMGLYPTGRANRKRQYINTVPAPVAQWIRAMGFYPTGRGFESLPGYQLKHRVLYPIF